MVKPLSPVFEKERHGCRLLQWILLICKVQSNCCEARILVKGDYVTRIRWKSEEPCNWNMNQRGRLREKKSVYYIFRQVSVRLLGLEMLWLRLRTGRTRSCEVDQYLSWWPKTFYKKLHKAELCAQRSPTTLWHTEQLPVSTTRWQTRVCRLGLGGNAR